MSKGRAKAPSQRQLRVGEELRHVLAQVLDRGELHDPAVQGTPITVTEVRASPDLKNATAFVVPLGGDEHTAELSVRVGIRDKGAGQWGRVCCSWLPGGREGGSLFIWMVKHHGLLAQALGLLVASYHQ